MALLALLACQTQAPPTDIRDLGLTLIADYSDNRIIEIDSTGVVVNELKEVFGVWDAEILSNGNYLITEFSVSRVSEVTRDGRVVWSLGGADRSVLNNPYDADRLPNGNTLIADTFGGRVIEVNAQDAIVWSYDKDIRPFDTDRLDNGNTLIADVLADRVIEVDPNGVIVWEAMNLPNIHDADRLPNGNTLVAENGMVREFDPQGKEVWKLEMTWAVEINRY